MRKQKIKLAVADGGLLGKFFYSFDDGRLCWQGQIMGEPHPGYYLVDTFDWFEGRKFDSKVVHITDIANNWLIFETADEMKNHFPMLPKAARASW